MNNQELVRQITEVTAQAGKILLAAHAESDNTYHKEGHANFVTKYDTEIQQFLIEELAKIIPEAEFLGEEDTEGSKAANFTGYTFIIDPIDGTTNFIFDYRHSCISIGLALKKEIIAGVVYNPYLGEMFSAARGAGAFLNGKKLQMTNLALEDGISTFGCARYHNDADEIFGLAKTLYEHSLAIHCGGSAALELTRIAAGRNAVYLELELCPWDYAASSLIIEEAGGIITKPDGTPVTLEKNCGVLAGTRQAYMDTKKLLENRIS